MLRTTGLTNLGSNSLDAFDKRCLILNLTQLDTEATQFHLIVDTTKELQLALFVPTSKVASVVNLHSERSNGELLLGQVFTLPIAIGHLGTAQTQLTSTT